MKNRKRAAQLEAAEREKKLAEEKQGNIMGVADCDIGLSPQMSKGSLSIPKKK